MRYNLEQAKNLVEGKIIRRGFSLQYRKATLSGVVFWDSKTCIIPQIKSRASLYIACHELYHCLRDRKGKVYIDEFKAEKFAHRFMRHLGFSIPRKQTKRAKRYINYKLRKAFNRGMKQENLNKEVK
jgi:hypothetical protein